MELFALGHGDGYTEDDVREGRPGAHRVADRPRRPRRLQPEAARRGGQDRARRDRRTWTGRVLRAVLARRLRPGYVATRLWQQFVSGATPSRPPCSARQRLRTGPRPHRAAHGDAHRPEFRRRREQLVIGPVEWLVGAAPGAAACRSPTTPPPSSCWPVLRALGQVPFYPPNVGGLAVRAGLAVHRRGRDAHQLAAALAGTADLSAITEAAAADRIDAVGYLLGVGAWSDRTAAVLKPRATSRRRSWPSRSTRPSTSSIDDADRSSIDREPVVDPTAHRRTGTARHGEDESPPVPHRLRGHRRRRAGRRRHRGHLAPALAPGRDRPLAGDAQVLVVVTLYGGNDGLNTVIPYTDPAYHAARPELAYAADEVLHLDDQLGPEPGHDRHGDAVAEQAAGHRARGRLPQARPQPLPLHGHLADRVARDARPAPAGSAAGWTRPATTRCGRSTSARCCRRSPSGPRLPRPRCPLGPASALSAARHGVDGARPQPIPADTPAHAHGLRRVPGRASGRRRRSARSSTASPRPPTTRTRAQGGRAAGRAA